MKKAISFLLLSILFVALYYGLSCYRDKKQLRNDVIRLHVVANSDSDADQAQKLRVRDVINQYLCQLLENVESAKDARRMISDHLSDLEIVASELLSSEGTDMAVRVTLTNESFDIREYDTFTLPSGVYSSLRIELGAAEGKNWWCVVFPSLCLPAAGNSFAETAAGAGFSDSLTGGLSGKYQFRFFVLDLFGQVEKFLANH
ncbi:MAG: stage II sporulation protein R [Ruminococcaceae bacterium]|nr:stage II sporulation protein R [Oscillospiraceae bacterium]